MCKAVGISFDVAILEGIGSDLGSQRRLVQQIWFRQGCLVAGRLMFCIKAKVRCCLAEVDRNWSAEEQQLRLFFTASLNLWQSSFCHWESKYYATTLQRWLSLVLSIGSLLRRADAPFVWESWQPAFDRHRQDGAFRRSGEIFQQDFNTHNFSSLLPRRSPR